MPHACPVRIAMTPVPSPSPRARPSRFLRNGLRLFAALLFGLLLATPALASKKPDLRALDAEVKAWFEKQSQTPANGN